MRPIDKTASDLFQKLRARYSPVTLGSEKAETTAEPGDARFFNFEYKDNEESLGWVTVSLVDTRSMKVFYSGSMIDNMENRAGWYAFLREMKNFAKRNMLTFDARDIAKSQLEPRDFKWLSKNDGKVDQDELTVSESAMYGSKRKSYQTLESVKIIVQHSKNIDENVRGARSRGIHSIYLEREDGERYKFPYNYLTGARAMARHIHEGNTPYDPMGQHILSMIKEMRDLSKFARMTKTHAMEDETAGQIREKIVERFQNLKSIVSSMGHLNGYKSYSENFTPQESGEAKNIDMLRERFTRRVWNTAMEDLLPSVTKALEGYEFPDSMQNKEAKHFENWANKITETDMDPEDIANDIDNMLGDEKPTSIEAVYSVINDYINDMDGDQELYDKDQIAQILLDRYNITEAAPTGTMGSMGTVPTQPANPQMDPKARAAMLQGTKNVTRMAQIGAGMKVPAGVMSKMVQALSTGKPIPRQAAMALSGFGNLLVKTAMQDPRKAAAATALLKKIRTSESKEQIIEGFETLFSLIENNLLVEKELKMADDQDGDGDTDFADVMVARKKASGMPVKKAIATTKDKPYNEDELSDIRKLSGI